MSISASRSCLSRASSASALDSCVRALSGAVAADVVGGAAAASISARMSATPLRRRAFAAAAASSCSRKRAFSAAIKSNATACLVSTAAASAGVRLAWCRSNSRSRAAASSASRAASRSAVERAASRAAATAAAAAAADADDVASSSERSDATVSRAAGDKGGVVCGQLCVTCLEQCQIVPKVVAQRGQRMTSTSTLRPRVRYARQPCVVVQPRAASGLRRHGRSSGWRDVRHLLHVAVFVRHQTRQVLHTV